ncbi:MAG: branched-chain amino acid ABC transporter ATP-binding protein/permease [Casimicrobiaceae bacterium]
MSVAEPPHGRPREQGEAEARSARLRAWGDHMSHYGHGFRHPVLWVAVAFAILPFVLPRFGSTVSLATEIAIYTLYGLGFNLLLGYTGLVSFGASAFFGMAGYAAGLAMIHVFGSVLPSVVFGTAFAALLGLVIGLLILRRRGIYFSLLTLAFTQLFYEITFKWTDLTGGENGLQGVSRPGLDNALVFHFFAATLIVAAMYVLWRIVHAPFGRVLQAIRDNEQRVQCLGYDTQRYKLGAFVLSATFIGLAGSLLTFLIQSVYADNLSWQHAGDPVMMTVLGGIHHFLGPLWGSIIYITLRDQLSSFTEHWWLAFGAILIAFILLSPEGVCGIWSRFTRTPRWTLTREQPLRKASGARPPLPRAAIASDDGPVLTVRGLRKSFGSLVVADNVGLELRRGELHSLIGPNGAGKTTLFNMVTGLIPCDGGEIRFGERDITRLPVHRRIAAGLARSFQIVSIFRDLTVFETVRIAAQAQSPHRGNLWRDAYDFDDINARTWVLLETVGIGDRAAETGGNLAHGEQRLLEIAVALATNPSVLLLDEPLAGLADADRERIAGLIRSLAGQHSILLIEHDIDRVLTLSDRITVLHQGRVIATGLPHDIARHPEVVTAYLGRHGDAPAAPAIGIESRTDRAPLLTLTGVTAGYGASVILHDVDLRVDDKEVVALLGRNGVGKTTTLRTMMGVVKPVAGRLVFRDTDITRASPDRINRQGMSIVPEGRRIFPNLSVLENLQLAQRPGGWSLDDVYDLFPKLRARAAARGENLSGGERQMLAIARSMMAPTSLILLDEPFEGLAPAVVGEVLAALMRLKDRTSILLVEQKVDIVMQMADRAYVMVNGRIAFEGAPAVLHRDEELQQKLLGVAV